MAGLARAVWVVMLCGFAALATAAPGAPGGTVLQEVSDRGLGALTKGLAPVGRPEPAARMDLAIALPLRNQAALTSLLNDLYTPGSPRFHQYLTSEQFAEQFGPTEADYQTLIAFAEANGLNIVLKHNNRTLLHVSGTVSDIERVFHVTMLLFPHPTEARNFYAPDKAPSLDIGIPILDVRGFDNYVVPHPVLRMDAVAKHPKTLANTGSGPGGNFSGHDFRRAYAPDVTLTGAGQNVALFEMDGYLASDISYYEATNGLASVTLTNVLLDGFSGAPDQNGGTIEVCLDIEMAIDMAPGLSKLFVYEAPLTSAAGWDMLNRIATDNLAKQISSSWVIDRIITTNPVSSSAYLQYAAQGQTFFQASGDEGEYCVNGTTFQTTENPYITTVGGTTLTTTGPGGSYVSETSWQWGGGTATGGGISTNFTIPTYQQGINMSGNGGSTTMRNVPDVALTADNVYVRGDGADQIGVGGTSAAAPLWAGFMALVNEQAAEVSQPPIGFINPSVYAIAQSSAYNLCFHDITVGNNTNSCSSTRFQAVAGYDLCTGWGSPAGQNLINALAPPDPLSISPIAGFYATGGPGGPFDTTSEVLTLTNIGTNSLTWSLSNTSTWLNASSSGGSLTPGGPAAMVTFSLNSVASNLLAGVHTSIVWFTNLSDGVGLSRTFTLNILGAPTIFSQPASITVPFGSSVSFTVGATGAPPVSYFWSRNSSPIAGATTATYTTNNVQVVDSGSQFSCLITNAYGSVTSQVATLTVSPSLIINGGFETGNFSGWSGDESGASVTSNSTYVHSGLYGVQAGPVGALGHVFQTFPTTPGSNYLVSVWMENIGGTPNEFQIMWNSTILYDYVNMPILGWTNLLLAITATGTSSTLQIGFRQDPSWVGFDDVSVTFGTSAPTITGQPANTTIPAGGNATFSVSALGSAPLSYAWRLGGAPIAGATASTYTTNSVPLAASGSQYSCVVTNAYGSVTSSNATLTVVSNGPVNFLLFSDNSANSLFATALADLGFSYQVYYSTQYTSFSAAVAGAGLANSVVIVDSSDNIFDFTNVTTYVNAGGSALLNYWDLTALPALASAFQASTISSFTTPEPVYNWGGSTLFNGVTTPISFSDLVNVDGQTLQPTGGASAVGGFVSSPTANEAALIIGNSGRTVLNGFLFAEITPTGNGVQLAANEILLQYNRIVAPSVSLLPPNQLVPAGRAAGFSASAAGVGPFSYQWKLNGTNINGATSSTYTNNSVTAAAGGLYSVTITNAGGAAAASGMLTVLIGSAPADYVMNGKYVSLPVGTNGQLLSFTLQEGGRFNPAGTGGTNGVDYWWPGAPIYNYVLGVGGTDYLNGAFWTLTVTNLSTPSLLRTLISGTVTGPLSFSRDVSFATNSKVVKFVDTFVNNGALPIPNVVTLDNIDPDQGIDGSTNQTYVTYNDVITVITPNDAVTAVGTNNGLSFLLGSESHTQIPSAVGFDNTDAYSFLTVVDPNGAPADIAINLAQNYGTIAAGRTNHVTWYMVFGSTTNEVMDGFALATGLPLLVLAPASMQNCAFSFTLSGLPGISFDLLSSTNLHSWTKLLTYTVPASGSVTFVDPYACTPVRQFYRARQSPTSQVQNGPAPDGKPVIIQR